MIWGILATLSEGKAATAANNGSAIYQLCSPAALLQKGQLALYMIFFEEQLSGFLAFPLASCLSLACWLSDPFWESNLRISLLKVGIWIFVLTFAIPYPIVT